MKDFFLKRKIYIRILGGDFGKGSFINEFRIYRKGWRYKYELVFEGN